MENNSNSNVHEFKNTLENLRKLDPQNIKKKPGGQDRRNNRNLEYDYVEWHVVADMLDEAVPEWQHTVKDIRQIGDFMVVTVAITIDGITREGIGTGGASSETGIKKAEHDALKRAAVKFGVARELYKKESNKIDRDGSRSSSGRGSYNNNFDPNRPPVNAISLTTADGATPKQKEKLVAMARDHSVDTDEICGHFLRCRFQELSKAGASWLISLMDSPEFQNKSATNDKVVQMPERKNDVHVSPGVAGKLLFEGGMVQRSPKGCIVTQSVQGQNCDFLVSIKPNEKASCSCGDFKTHVNVKKEFDYQCCHIVAAELCLASVASSQTQTAS